MVEIITTKDNKGNDYLKYRINTDGNAVVCTANKNKHYRGQPNISIRTGDSKFGKEVVFQLQARELVSEYDSSSGFKDHIEIYFTEEQLKEILTPLIKALKLSTANFNPGEWEKDKCERCGEHNFCKKCNKYTWSKKDGNN